MIYGARNVNTNTALMIGRASSNNTNLYSYYNTDYATVKTMSGNDWLSKHTYTINKNKVYFDSSLIHTFTSASFDTRTNCYIFAVSETGAANFKTSARIHSFKLWQDGTNLTLDMIPVQDRYTKEVGLYDRVEDKLYKNNGSGEFILGPEL